MKEIVLYPGNWLYNAGIVGFLRVLEATRLPGLDVQSFLSSDGTVKISDFPDSLFEKENVDGVPLSLFSRCFFQESWDLLLSEEKKRGIDRERDIAKVIQGIWGVLFNVYYRGFFSADTNKIFIGTKKDPKPLLQKFDEFAIKAITPVPAPSEASCSFCGDACVTFDYKNRFSCEHSQLLGSSASTEKGMPNSFWGNNIQHGLPICDRCSFMLLCSHLALIVLADGSRIFLNAPSFQVMWYLNRLVREIYARENIASVREILGMSLIELALRLGVQFGVWTEMNIEVVSIRGKEVSFCSLPYEVTRLLLDRGIASSLSEVGEMSVLRMVLDRQFAQILQLGERLLAIALRPKGEWGKQEKQYINDNIHLERNKESGAKLMDFAARLFSLYALVQEKLGGDRGEPRGTTAGVS